MVDVLTTFLLIDFTWYFNSKRLSENENKYMYNCESVSLLRDRCYLIIERFNFESYKNSDNGVYLFEIKIDEHDITE